jgi:hypothetical protein
VIWTDEKNRLKLETVKALIIVKTYFKNLSCAEFYDQILMEDGAAMLHTDWLGRSGSKAGK